MSRVSGFLRRSRVGAGRGRRTSRARTGGTPGAVRVHKDSDAVFDAAIRNGVLSDDPACARYAGHYMYLFHDAGGTAWFKHRDSRVSVTMPPHGHRRSRKHDRA